MQATKILLEIIKMALYIMKSSARLPPTTANNYYKVDSSLLLSAFLARPEWKFILGEKEYCNIANKTKKFGEVEKLC